MPAGQKCRQIFDLIRSLTRGEQGLTIDLIHRNGKLTGGTISLIRDTIPLPGLLLLKRKAFLKGKYQDENLSARAIARRIGVGSSTVAVAIHKHGLASETQRDIKRPQHVPFGYDFKNGKFVAHRKEQQTIRQMRQLRTAGLTYRDIAAHPNRKLVATKRSRVWDPQTVLKILSRSERPKGPDAAL